jgi:hypothetical protein
MAAALAKASRKRQVLSEESSTPSATALGRAVCPLAFVEQA